ncbi:MAG: hypothetical protein K6B46_00555 [Opitutales bacterium]|nr:hypothetical protein [Opitutales bacterium]
MEDKGFEIDFSELLEKGFTDLEAKPSPTEPRERRSDKFHGRRPHGNGAMRERAFRGNDSRGNAGEKNARSSHRFGGKRNAKPSRPFPPQPVATLHFYPEDKPIIALVNAIKNSGRTYTLFSIALLLLERPDRFNVMILPLPRKGETEAQALSISVPDNMPFLREEDAFNHACELVFDSLFDSAEIELDPPKGEYKMVALCETTGAVIGAPNHHGYNLALRRYHEENFPNWPFEKFMMTVKNSTDEVLVKSWLESMTKQTIYILKDRAEGEPEKFESKHAAVEFLKTHRREKMIATASQWRIPGTMIEKLPQGKLRAQIESELAKQRKFPLETANGFRGRLRHMGLVFFRKAPEGIVVVSGIRRKFRTPSTHFSDEVLGIFKYLDEHQGARLDVLLSDILGEGATDADKAKLAGSVRWLVSEGYVCEMEKGELFVFQAMTEEQAKAAENNEAPKPREALEPVLDESGITESVPVMTQPIEPPTE